MPVTAIEVISLGLVILLAIPVLGVIVAYFFPEWLDVTLHGSLGPTLIADCIIAVIFVFIIAVFLLIVPEYVLTKIFGIGMLIQGVWILIILVPWFFTMGTPPDDWWYWFFFSDVTLAGGAIGIVYFKKTRKLSHCPCALTNGKCQCGL